VVFAAAKLAAKSKEEMRILMGLLVLFVIVVVAQAYFLSEGFGSSQGGALIQLAASRPVVCSGSFC
jgi:hypothetical protein